MDILNTYKENLFQINDEFFKDYEILYNKNIDNENKINILNNELKKLQEDYDNYGKVSIIKNLNTQLNEKNNIIRILNEDITRLENKINNDNICLIVNTQDNP